MSQSVDSDAGQRVKVAFAITVPQPNAFSVREGDWQASIGVHQM